ncbi:50S ribosomal protein L30, partial [Corynebacterium diphtheriae]
MFEPTRKNIQPSDATLVITQTRGVTGSKQNHRDTLRSLGLKRIGSVTRSTSCAAPWTPSRSWKSP